MYLFVGYFSIHKHIPVLGSPQPPNKASANSSYPKENRRDFREEVMTWMMAQGFLYGQACQAQAKNNIGGGVSYPRNSS